MMSLVECGRFTAVLLIKGRNLAVKLYIDAFSSIFTGCPQTLREMGRRMVSKKNDIPVVYSALEVANICGVVNQTAINWIRNNYLKAFKTPGGQYRVYPEDLVEFMEKRGMRVPTEVIDRCEKKVVVSPHTILIVDDDKAFNEVMSEYIRKHDENAQISQAFDGFEAGLLMVQKLPKCVILDLDLPGIDGLKLCQKLSSTDAFGHPAVIVVTAAQDAEIEAKCIALGVREYFKKPLTLSKVAEAIARQFPGESGTEETVDAVKIEALSS